ncbi:DUF2167 domain-containing protein [Psychromonas ossibalaenae]|uniref:DUF2167 domain-containing protein n=1 Tax=Psychromonas ossibalaenae TaxID=444922 RepID=UPI000366D7B5|nr:DUF2167 domain-containing protein [Psychromonas ossibalaenae]
MNIKHLLFSLLILMPLGVAAGTGTELSEEQQYTAWANGILDSLNPLTGEIKLPGAAAVLNVPDDFYYLSPADADKILVDVWGNPPQENNLGMLFPAGMTPFDMGSWAVTIEYEEDGYVSVQDADNIDYADLLEQMQDDTADASKERVNQGYEEVELIGWASAPFYDAQSHKLHWAKEIRFGNETVNTLNYNIRVLGRKGVLVLNFIAQIDQKQLIESELDTVLALAEFEPQAKYENFDPQVDQMAAYGLGALVAGKVLAKTGFLAMGLIFFKKFGIFLIVAAGALIKKIFQRG